MVADLETSTCHGSNQVRLMYSTTNQRDIDENDGGHKHCSHKAVFGRQVALFSSKDTGAPYTSSFKNMETYNQHSSFIPTVIKDTETAKKTYHPIHAVLDTFTNFCVGAKPFATNNTSTTKANTATAMISRKFGNPSDNFNQYNSRSAVGNISSLRRPTTNKILQSLSLCSMVNCVGISTNGTVLNSAELVEERRKSLHRQNRFFRPISLSDSDETFDSDDSDYSVDAGV